MPRGKSKSTAEGDIRVSEQLTPEQMKSNDRFDLGQHMLTLFWDEPFYAILYRAVHRVRTRDIPTAGVGVFESRITLFWNPDFLAKLIPRHVRGILKHEAGHLIYQHCTTRRYEPHVIWNWAADLSINCAIPEDELPEGGLIPGKAFKPLTKDDIEKSKMTPEQVKRYQHLSDLIKSFPSKKQAEWYYSELMKDPEVQQMMREAEALKQFAEALAKAMGDGKGVHDVWDEIPQEQRDLIDGQIRAALEEAVSHADNHNGWGSVPSDLREEFRAMLRNEINWKQVLRNFIGQTRRANSRNSMKRLSRKQPYVFPGRVKNYTANLWIYTDWSGSVSNRALEILFGELNNLAKIVAFRVIPFTAVVHEDAIMEWRKGQKRPEILRTHSGGTSFDAVLAHANTHAGDHDGIMVLTDGECSQPVACRKRLAWVVAPGNKLYFQPRQGEVLIQLTEEEGK